MAVHRIECFAENLHDPKMSLYRDPDSYADLIVAQAFDRLAPSTTIHPTNKEDTMTASAEVTAANPESIRHIPSTMTSEQRNHFTRLLGIHDELKASAAIDGTADLALIDAALARTQLTTEDKIKAKIILFGSGFSKRRG
jgi:hypothetical protein